MKVSEIGGKQRAIYIHVAMAYFPTFAQRHSSTILTASLIAMIVFT